ncbi:MAG TPA: NAD(P)-dependent oxidoreductase [Solirubrobacteraceae bacterium]|nr:NAD(P)-dependent oxidoreductase [Solirubrobacteraceae bacterium]
MARVLLTGAGGFVGRPLLDELLARGHEVHALDVLPPDRDGGEVRWWQVDLDDAAGVRELLERLRPEKLVHMAWYVKHGSFWTSPENVAWVRRSIDLLMAFVAAGGRRALLAGTCAEYDWGRSAEPFDELRSPLAPATLYGTAKDALRRVASGYAEQEGLELAWGRLFLLYGPREAPGRLVPSVINALLAGEPAETTSGAQRRDFMHVADVAGALATVLDSELSGPVNIASGQAVPIAEVVRTIAEIAGRPELVRLGALPDREGEPELLGAQVRRLREEAGFEPRFGLRDGLQDAVAWWQERREAAG